MLPKLLLGFFLASNTRLTSNSTKSVKQINSQEQWTSAMESRFSYGINMVAY
jgi:hypothetical protein